ncbi:MAG: hypothetical protein EA344_06205 [Alkalicoccus sp.]|nr:MAG: hypothetical protein EA344_06205 [Alkalicoccus sp.]
MWMTLWKKEWQESLPRFGIVMGVFLLMYAGILTASFNTSAFALLLGFFAVGLHLVLLLLLWALSFHGEWRSRTQWTWLNIPAPGWKLVTAKLAAGFSQYVISIALLTAVGFLAMRIFASGLEPQLRESIEMMQSVLTGFFPLMLLALTYGAVFLGLGLVFIILMARSVKKVGWVIGLVSALLFSYVYSAFNQSSLYAALFHHGVVFDAEQTMQNVTSGSMNFQLEIDQGASIYAGQLAVEMLLIAGIIALLSWMVDRFVQPS